MDGEHQLDEGGQSGSQKTIRGVDVGMWIWRLAKAENGDVELIRGKARGTGLRHLIIKITDGVRRFNGPKLRPVFDALRPDLQLWVWTYTYGKDPEREAEVFGERAVALNAFGLVVDAEGDDYQNSRRRARRFMLRLREIVGDLHVGLSSHRFPSLHKTVPIATFMESCDSGWPQAYYLHPSVEENLASVLQEWRAYEKPVIVTGAAYKTSKGDAVGDPRNIGVLLRRCEAEGIAQVNFWEWSFATQPMWDEIQAYIGGV